MAGTPRKRSDRSRASGYGEAGYDERGAVNYSADAGVRVPPHSVEAEQAVLGGLMLDNRSWDAVADRLTAEDFFRRDHQLIFEIGRAHV